MTRSKKVSGEELDDALAELTKLGSHVIISILNCHDSDANYMIIYEEGETCFMKTKGKSG